MAREDIPILLVNRTLATSFHRAGEIVAAVVTGAVETPKPTDTPGATEAHKPTETPGTESRPGSTG
jgi:hypothetical protein